MVTTLRFLQLLALGVWLGGMAVFSFIVAPAVFAVLPSRHLAGDLVTVALARMYMVSVLCGAVFVGALVAEQMHSGGVLRGIAMPVVLLAAALALGSYNQYGLTPPMAGLRAEMKATFGSVDETPTEHPLRARFNRYHGISMALMSGELLLVAALLFVTVRRFR